ncbi:Phospholipase B-like [Entamoeba marina]
MLLVLKRTLFSSYPGITHSLDDFWLLDNGLVVIETTMHCWNQDQFEKCSPESVLTWIRVQIANMLSTSVGGGVKWAQDFIRENSGTYNNQYIIVDYNKFNPGSRPLPGTLYAIEQMPGFYGVGDRTEELIENTFIPSVNSPFFSEVYDYAGLGEKCEEENDWYFDYWKSQRMLLIQRDAPGLSDYEEFKAFMRYNDYPNDPLVNDPGQFILSRYDLRPPECIPSSTNPSIVHCPSNFGGLDSKTVNYNRVKNLQIDAISSPNYEQQPVYEFGKKPFDTDLYTGLPKTWQFDWIVFNEEGF